MTYSNDMHQELVLKLWPDPERSEEDDIDEQEHVRLHCMARLSVMQIALFDTMGRTDSND